MTSVLESSTPRTYDYKGTARRNAREDSDPELSCTIPLFLTYCQLYLATPGCLGLSFDVCVRKFISDRVDVSEFDWEKTKALEIAEPSHGSKKIKRKMLGYALRFPSFHFHAQMSSIHLATGLQAARDTAALSVSTSRAKTRNVEHLEPFRRCVLCCCAVFCIIMIPHHLVSS